MIEIGKEVIAIGQTYFAIQTMLADAAHRAGYRAGRVCGISKRRIYGIVHKMFDEPTYHLLYHFACSLYNFV